MKLDLKTILKDVAEMEKLSIQNSTDNCDSIEVPGISKHTYLIVDGSGLNFTEIEDAALVDKSTVLLAVLLFEFYDDDSLFGQLCAREFEGVSDLGQMMFDWHSKNKRKFRERFEFIEQMPYTPTDIVNIGNTFLIEMTHLPDKASE